MACKSDNSKAQNVVEIVKDSTDLIDMDFFKKEGDAYILSWDLLMKVKLVDSFDVTLQKEVAVPHFNDTLRSLNGKNVIVEGFYIPVDETGDSEIVILSAFPFSQCFFCGKAGIESIMDVLSPKELPKMKVDSKIKFKGKLKLNAYNYDYLIYVLEKAELISK